MSFSEMITATAHKLARILSTEMRYDVAYQKRSDEVFVTEHRERQEKNLHRRAKELGYEWVKSPASDNSLSS